MQNYEYQQFLKKELISNLKSLKRKNPIIINNSKIFCKHLIFLIKRDNIFDLIDKDPYTLYLHDKYFNLDSFISLPF